ncbi:MAG TPA: hypothetical protein VGM51_17710 [Armatimonadota bacterium]
MKIHAAIFAFAIISPAWTALPPGAWAPPRVLCNIADARITEASGIVESRRNPGIVYVHNDSGDSARFFAVGRDGKTRFVVTVRNAANTDWEDIAATRDSTGAPVVFLADIGDNEQTRDVLTIYQVVDPAAPKGPAGATVGVEARAIRFRYPNGHHDAETLLAEPAARALYVVTKTRKQEPSEIFRLDPRAPGVQTAVKVGELRFSDPLPIYTGMATGGDISPDGSRVVVRTYQCAYEWPVARGESVERALRAKPRVTVLALENQGEAICYGLGGKTLFTTSEQCPTPIYVYQWRMDKRNVR